MPTVTKRKRTTNSATVNKLVMCRKIILKDGTRTIFNGTYGENDWGAIRAKLVSLYDGQGDKGTFAFSSTKLMATPTAHL